jgi:hypothetical protein
MHDTRHAEYHRHTSRGQSELLPLPGIRALRAEMHTDQEPHRHVTSSTCLDDVSPVNCIEPHRISVQPGLILTALDGDLSIRTKKRHKRLPIRSVHFFP